MCKYRYLFFIMFLSVVNVSFAANQGLITGIGFSSSQSSWGPTHSDIVQITIEGGFENLNAGCHTTLAAIRKVDQHLISAALSAFMANKSIIVNLSNNDKYWDGTRCIITDLSIAK